MRELGLIMTEEPTVVHAVELAKVVLPPLVIFGLFCAGFWLLNRHANAIGHTLEILGISKVGFMGLAVEVVHERLRTAALERRGIPEFSKKDEREVRRLTKYLAPLVGGGRVLWVDDEPSGNRHERAALTRLWVWHHRGESRRGTMPSLAAVGGADPHFAGDACGRGQGQTC